MPTAKNDDLTTRPFAHWLEECIREMINANPEAIAMSMVSEYGLVSTCYYNTSANDRACMIDAMRDDAHWEFIFSNKKEIRAVLEDDSEGEEDGLQDADSEVDSEE